MGTVRVMRASVLVESGAQLPKPLDASITTGRPGIGFSTSRAIAPLETAIFLNTGPDPVYGFTFSCAASLVAF